MAELNAKVLVIGGGPGGYVTAIRAGQLGLDTVVVDMGPVGGTCLNVGCIPSKALIEAAGAFHAASEDSRAVSPFGLSVEKPALDFRKTMEWKEGIVGRLTGGVASLLKRHKVRTIHGKATMRDGKTAVVETDTETVTIHAEHVVIAAGSVPVELPGLPFGGKVISSTGALALREVPKALAVVGAGYIGLELGMAYARLGSKVTVIEAIDRVLPGYDAELTRPLAKSLADLGVEVLLGARANGLGEDGDLVVTLTDGSARAIAAQKVLVAVGRRPRTDGWGLEGLDLAMTGPFVRIDERCATSMRNVWAVGDITGEPMLAHRAMAQGEMVAEIIAGARRSFEPLAIPAICFTSPEIVSVGVSPDAARDAGYEIITAHFPFAANGRALTRGSDEGMVRVVARADNHLVLGMAAVGHEVSELAGAFAMAIEMGARLEDLAAIIQAHPTQAEAIREVAARALGHPVHI
ncbi:MAG TPA: dihydrolipoyl dehydrogenase [Devosiaceae bacterium]